MCRAWRRWEDDKKVAEKLSETERKFNVQLRLMQGLTKGRLYGGAAMLMGIKGQKFEEELDTSKVGKDDLVFLHVVERWQIAAGPLVRDITSPWFGEPSYYMRSNVPIATSAGLGVELKPELEQSSLGYQPGSQLIIHPSRVIRLLGHEYPDMERAQDAWSDSVLQPIHDAIRNAGMVSSSISSMIAEAKLDIIKMPGLTNAMSTTEGTNKVFNRFANANAAKSVINTILLDKDEEWERKELHFSNMDKVMQMYLAIAAAAADIPATRLLSKSPDGQNATGDSDTRNYYDRLASDQVVRLTPAMRKLDEVIIRSTLGTKDPDSVRYTWNSLWQESDEVKAGTALKKAQVFQIDVNSALLDPEVLKQGREAQLVSDNFYPGLDKAIEETGDQDYADIVEEPLHPDEDPEHQKALELIEAKGKFTNKGNGGASGRPN